MGQTITKNVAKRWVTALRSGNFEQGKLTLKQDGKYCCLGVLAKTECWRDNLGHLVYPDTLIDGYREIFGGLTIENFTTMNDRKNMSFDEIADVIEQEIGKVEEYA